MMFIKHLLMIPVISLALPKKETLDHFLKVQIESQSRESFIIKQTTAHGLTQRTLTYVVGNKEIREVPMPPKFFFTMLQEGEKYANTFSPQGDCGHSGLSIIEIKSSSDQKLQASKKTFCHPPKSKMKEWKQMKVWFSKLVNYSHGQMRR